MNDFSPFDRDAVSSKSAIRDVTRELVDRHQVMLGVEHGGSSGGLGVG